MRKDFIIAGFGGQGVQSLGKALARVLDKKGFLVSLKSNYGPETRGGVSYTEVVVKETPDDWPEVLTVNVLVAMSQQAYNAWIGRLAPEAQVFYDTDFVTRPASINAPQYPVPATKMATELGAPIAANMVMLGAVMAITDMAPLATLQEVIQEEMGRRAAISLKAAEAGYKEGSLTGSNFG